MATPRARDDRSLPPRELARLSRSLALLLSAGMALDAALDALAGAETQRLPRALHLALHEGVRAGTPLSVAVAARPNAFPPWYAAAIEVRVSPSVLVMSALVTSMVIRRLLFEVDFGEIRLRPATWDRLGIDLRSHLDPVIRPIPLLC